MTSPRITTAKVDAAIGLLSRDFSIIPCHSPDMPLDEKIPPNVRRRVDPQSPEYDERAVGKIPLVEWKPFMERRATEGELRKWWAKWPLANPAIVTGRVSGIFTAEADGAEALDRLAEIGVFPGSTLTSRACRGPHLLFRHPSFPVRNSAGELAPGLDIRGDGGYIVAPGSLHRTGHLYAWEADIPIVPAPTALLDLLRQKPKTDGVGRRLAADEVDRLLEGVEDGKRHSQLITLAGHFLGLGLPIRECERILLAVNDRNRPPVPEEHVLVRVRDIAKRDAERRANPEEPTVSRDGDDFTFLWAGIAEMRVTDLRDASDGLMGLLSVSDPRGKNICYQRLKFASASNRADTVKELSKACPLVPDDSWASMLRSVSRHVTEAYQRVEVVNLRTLPPTTRKRPLVDGRLYIPADETTVLFADGGSGKTTLASLLCLGVAAGVDLPLGTVQRGPVLYVSYEDSGDSIRAMLAALAKGLGIPTPDFHFLRLYRPLAEVAQQVRAAASRVEAALVIVDSYVPAAGEKPEGADAAQRVFRTLDSLSPAARIVLAHVSKEDAERSNGRRPFGSAFVWNLPRNVWEMDLLKAEDHNLTARLVHRKINWGRRRPTFGLAFEYEGPADMPDRVQGSAFDATAQERQTKAAQIRDLLAEGEMTAQEVGRALEMPDNEVRFYLSNRPEFRVVGQRGRAKVWGLAEDVKTPAEAQSLRL